jgi:hypothetical protein
MNLFLSLWYKRLGHRPTVSSKSHKSNWRNAVSGRIQAVRLLATASA